MYYKIRQVFVCMDVYNQEIGNGTNTPFDIKYATVYT